MTEVEELRPVPRERAILESFFTQLGMFSFDRAKDYVEKEKDNSKSAGAIWAALLAALAHLAAAEKAYHNMTFLGQKMGNVHLFLRKDRRHLQPLKPSLSWGVLVCVTLLSCCDENALDEGKNNN